MIQTTDAPSSALTDTLRLERSNALRSRVLQVAASVYQAIAIIAFIAALFLAGSWLRTPFIGALFEQTNVFNGATPSGDAGTWFLYNQGVRFGDRLISVNNINVRNAADVAAYPQGLLPR